MNVIRSLTLYSGVLTLFTSSACAQGLGQRIVVDIAIDSIVAADGDVTLSYNLLNRAQSKEELFFFSIDAPQGTIAIGAPGDPTDWSLGKTYRGKKVASWGIVGEQLAPGRSVSGLWYSATGVIGLVEASVGGYVPPQPLPTEAEMRANPSLATDPDPRIANAIRVVVPAVVPAPPGGASGLLALLRQDEGAVCATPSGTNRGLCRSLDAKLQAADAALGRGNTAAVLGQLGAFVSELTTRATAKAQLGQTYWLLLGNAKVLIARLGGS